MTEARTRTRTRTRDWSSDAACLQYPSELFFPVVRTDRFLEARRICAACPVLAQCRDWTDRVEGGTTLIQFVHGFYAAESPRQRVRRRRRAAAAAAPTAAAALRRVSEAPERPVEPSERPPVPQHRTPPENAATARYGPLRRLP